MSQQEGAIHLGGATLDRYRHVCAFFHSRDEEYRVLLPFVHEGIAVGEKIFQIIDPRLRQDHVWRLAADGLDVEAAERRGQLEIQGWEDAYLRGGSFNQEAMLRLIENVLERGKAEGFPLTRLVANMEWALEQRPGVDDIVEYEARLNYILPRYKDAVV